MFSDFVARSSAAAWAISESRLGDLLDSLCSVERRGANVGMGLPSALATETASSCASMRWYSLSACIWIFSSTSAGRSRALR